jgi:peptidoglycan/LPS O-acetylase OafA/YrhL
LFGRIDQFLIGMGAAIVYRALASRRLGGLGVAAVALLPFVLFAFNRAGGLANQSVWKVLWPTAEGLLWSGFIIGYMQLGERLPAWPSRVLASIGEVSFSMYLLHVAVIAAVLKLGPPSFGLGPSGAAIANALCLVLPGTVGVSWITFRLIERPFLRLRVRYLGAAVAGIPAPGTEDFAAALPRQTVPSPGPEAGSRPGGRAAA